MSKILDKLTDLVSLYNYLINNPDMPVSEQEKLVLDAFSEIKEIDKDTNY